MTCRYWNQSVLLRTRPGLDPAAVAASLAAVVTRHEALRLRFARTDTWSARPLPTDAAAAIELVDLRSTRDPRRAILESCSAAQRSLDIERGPLVRAQLMDFGAGQAGRLFIAIHHLAVDGVSWRIILEDLRRGCEAHLSGGPPLTWTLPDPAFGDWTEALAAATSAGRFDRDLAFWRSQVAGSGAALPLDVPVTDRSHTFATIDRVSLSLDAGATLGVLHGVTAATGAGVDHILIAALLRTLGLWTRQRTHLLAIEGHGRQALAGQLEPVDTVGWLTSLFPRRLDSSAGSDPLDHVRAVRAQLLATPEPAGYGALLVLAPGRSGPWRDDRE